jgi:glycosyltransferase involved in cell wall biosynthesis
MPRIAVDLTPLRSGGENGGAKILVLQLLSEFQHLSHNYDFLLLTAGWNHQELAGLEGPRIKRLCVLPLKAPPTEPATGSINEHLDRILHRMRQGLPPQVVSFLLQLAIPIEKKLRYTFSPIPHPRPSGWLLREHHVDLLFCPFTAPTYAESQIPVVSIVYDLQHRTYPQFFDPREVTGRDATLEQLRGGADAIICISEYTRQTLLTHLDIAPERTHTVHVCIHSRLSEIVPAPNMLSEFQIGTRSYMFYPANFWSHKNHRMLLTAYNILLRRHPELELDLVFTGALAQQEQELRYAAKSMGLEQRVHFLGYLPDEQLAAVFHGCQFIIYPSLYEGFGIPILEAFTFGKPVLCSNGTSLPEIGGEAALYFDPRRPMAIVQAIEELLNQPQLTEDLAQRGYQQLAKFRQEDMVRRYLEIFDQTLQKAKITTDGLTGVFADGWLSQEMEISYTAYDDTRILELILSAPAWLPYRKITIQYKNNAASAERWFLSRGRTTSLRLPLSPEGGHITLCASPLFKPSERLNSNDERWLSCLCQSCRIVYPDGSHNVLF